MSESDELANHLDRLFLALGSRPRRAILQQLRQGPARVTELAEPFAMSLNAVSKHLKVLEDAALIRRERRGREFHFRIEPQLVQAAEEWLRQLQRTNRRSAPNGAAPAEPYAYATATSTTPASRILDEEELPEHLL